MVLEPQFDLKHVLTDIAKHKPSTFSGAPRIYNAIINSPLAKEYDLKSIGACISGSAPLLVETHRKFVELTGANLVEGYGLTEAAPVTHCNPLFGKGKQKIGTIGVPYPDVECKIVDSEGGIREMPVGEPGELILRGPQLMDGYYNRPDETASTHPRRLAVHRRYRDRRRRRLLLDRRPQERDDHRLRLQRVST